MRRERFLIRGGREGRGRGGRLPLGLVEAASNINVAPPLLITYALLLAAGCRET